MPRAATGQLIEPSGRQKSWALRFRVPGTGKRHYITLGRPEDGWNRKRAERELGHVLADVERGLWKPPAPEPIAPPREDHPSFHSFASEWFERHRPEWRPTTIADYEWQLSHHLLPHFADFHLSQIDVRAVDDYKSSKLREGRLSATSINKTLVRLGQILEEAEEYGLIDRNPALGKRRRVKASPPPRSWVEPEQLMALLDGCDSWHRPLIATLAGAGLRVGEAVALDWSDVNLATGTIVVRESKTAAGAGRRVDMPGGLVEQLTEWKARSPRRRTSDPVFCARARNGRFARQRARNVQTRLKGAIKRANRRLEEQGIEPISEKVSPHSLRRTYASLRGALRDDPVYIAEQLGHTDPRFTLSVYAKAAKRRERLSGDYLKAFDRALDWAATGRIGETAPSEAIEELSGDSPNPA
jgi:integrase